MTKARDLANSADVFDDVSTTELGYLNGVSSAIQTQIDGKQAVVSGVDNTEIGYLDGVTSAIQTQLDAKVAKSLVDAKGDLLVGTANDTVGRLAVASTAGYLLSVDSAETTGLKWAAPAGASFAGAIVYGGTTQTIANNTFTALTFSSETFDTDSYHDNSTNTSRFTIPSGKGGKYAIFAQTYWVPNGTGYRQFGIYKNGSAVYYTGDFPGNASFYENVNIYAVVNCAVSDYLEIFAYQNSGGNLNIYKAADLTFGITYLGA